MYSFFRKTCNSNDPICNSSTTWTSVKVAVVAYRDRKTYNQNKNKKKGEEQEEKYENLYPLFLTDFFAYIGYTYRIMPEHNYKYTDINSQYTVHLPIIIMYV